eukprot:CAMPEP_0171985780 /NCGR_PEP_ID=MMETSP0993-20121228/274533_1 /TAXON_ID=483369 /ORGANISM="non described non described, Strain CCMP2098" /LENGTH=210 /DNA_ID=CAMNT_0012638667 /DNA_START=6 /DNA_END=639 /DNA_ORIENTATION=-
MAACAGEDEAGVARSHGHGVFHGAPEFGRFVAALPRPARLALAPREAPKQVGQRVLPVQTQKRHALEEVPVGLPGFEEKGGDDDDAEPPPAAASLSHPAAAAAAAASADASAAMARRNTTPSRASASLRVTSRVRCSTRLMWAPLNGLQGDGFALGGDTAAATSDFVSGFDTPRSIGIVDDAGGGTGGDVAEAARVILCSGGTGSFSAAD